MDAENGTVACEQKPKAQVDAMTSFWTHDSLSIIIPVLLVPPLLVLYAWCSGRRDKAAHGAYAALHSPSVRTARNAFDRRVAIAVREAKMGSQECASCGFTNAVRVETCVLCGGEQLRGPRGVFAGKWWRCAVRPKPKGPSVNAWQTQVSSRQQRIRRRREWTRVVDEGGRSTWRRDTGAATQLDTLRLPSYVLQTERRVVDEAVLAPVEAETRTTPKQTAPPLAGETSLEVVTIDTAVDTDTPPSPPVLTPDQVVSALEAEWHEITVRVVDSTGADPAHIAYGAPPSAEAAAMLADSIRSVQLHFPAKVAHFITSTASIFSANDTGTNAPATRLAIHRTSLLADSMSVLGTMTVAQARAGVRVEFLGEQGIDAGGVYREWFLLLNEAIIQPDAGIFVCVDKHDQAFYLNPQSRAILGENHLMHFFAAGRVLGRALLEGNVTGFHLALPLLKIILGLPVGFGDLQYFDPDAYKNLCWLLDNDGVDMLGLDFTVTETQPNGRPRDVELKPGGGDIDVTDANKREYVELKTQYLLFGSVQTQLFAFLKGLYEIVPAELLVLFDAEELAYVMSGSDEIDVDDWERSTVVSKNLEYFPAAELFWKVVRELSQDERRRLLQFATGSTRVPPGGFSALTSNDGQLCLFALRGVEPKETRGYLHSHACFNRVDLPLHRKLKDMRQAVRAAIVGDNIIGFTTD